jgi:DNA-binding transcriptional regulator YiaG
MQKQVARQLWVNVETLKNWERGVGTPLPRQVPRIMDFLGYDPEPEPKGMPQRIVHIRSRLGFTQEQFAKALAVDPVTVYRWEKGLATVSSEILLRMKALAAEPLSTTLR